MKRFIFALATVAVLSGCETTVPKSYVWEPSTDPTKWYNKKKDVIPYWPICNSASSADLAQLCNF